MQNNDLGAQTIDSFQGNLRMMTNVIMYGSTLSDEQTHVDKNTRAILAGEDLPMEAKHCKAHL